VGRKVGPKEAGNRDEERNTEIAFVGWTLPLEVLRKLEEHDAGKRKTTLGELLVENLLDNSLVKDTLSLALAPVLVGEVCQLVALELLNSRVEQRALALLGADGRDGRCLWSGRGRACDRGSWCSRRRFC